VNAYSDKKVLPSKVITGVKLEKSQGFVRADAGVTPQKSEPVDLSIIVTTGGKMFNASNQSSFSLAAKPLFQQKLSHDLNDTFDSHLQHSAAQATDFIRGRKIDSPQLLVVKETNEEEDVVSRGERQVRNFGEINSISNQLRQNQPKSEAKKRI